MKTSKIIKTCILGFFFISIVAFLNPQNATGKYSILKSTINQYIMENGKGDFYTSFKPNGFKEEVNVGDELYVRMNLGKTMIELLQEKGFEAGFTAYGFITVYIDGNKSFTAGPYSFASNYSKKWTYIDIPLNINPDFIEKISADQSMLETEQDIWVFQQLFQEKSVPKMYAASAMTSMTEGNHTLKVEFGLSSSESSEPQTIVCSGTVKVVSDAAGSEEIAQNGPKYLRPLKADEKGKFTFNSISFTPGTAELKANLELPQAPKYYNMKWCQASSCDYDEGNIEFYVSIDGQPLVYWSSFLENNDYTADKSFNFVVLPKTDAGIGSVEAGFNQSKLFRTENPLVYSLFDILYSGNLKTGKHTLTLKAFSKQSIPLNSSYEFSSEYFKKLPAIAETSIDIVVTEADRNTLINSSSAKKLSHATGEWVSVDSKLKTSNTGGDFEIIDVATTTLWKVVTNSLGAILYRTCKADVVYKSQYGTRLQKDILVKEDFMGGGSYGTPYFADRIEASYGPSLLNSIHLPVPASKVK